MSPSARPPADDREAARRAAEQAIRSVGGWRELQVAELSIASAEIAGVFVGFAALIAI